MSLDAVGVAAEWAIAHPFEYATLILLSLAAARVVVAMLTGEKMPNTPGLVYEIKYDPPLKIDWVHVGQILVDPSDNHWEVTFVGPDFVTVSKIKNVSYDEVRSWRVVL